MFRYTEGEVKEARKSLYLWAERDKPHLPARTFKTYLSGALQLGATVSGFARQLHGDGYTELLGEIDLKITGRTESKAGIVEAEIAVVLTTNITNRFDGAGTVDVVLISNKGKILSRARIRKAYSPRGGRAPPQGGRRSASKFQQPRRLPDCQWRDCRRALNAHRTAGVALLQDRFEQAKAQHDLPKDSHPAALARFLAAVVYGMAVIASGGASRKELDQVIRTAMTAWPTTVQDRTDRKFGRGRRPR